MSKEPTGRIRDILSVKVEQARDGDYLALLECTESASDRELKDAYFKLARLVHPDSLQKQSLADRREDAAFIFEKLTEAFQTLKDPHKRKAWEERRKSGQPAPADKGKMLEEHAKIALHQGKLLLNRRAYAEAEAQFKRFTEIKTEDARGFLFLGWAIFQNQNRPLEARLEEARICFNRAQKMQPDNADVYYYLARNYKERGLFPEVERQLKKCIELNKDHVGALRERRLLEMRQGQGPGVQSVGGYLKDLLGKFKKK
ncbi:MAG: hypothetical protein FJ109_05000 [Deltaproteobacteria bacterium]|nr:hypothetical protein [Deltaproteobacteria bacterium]